MGIGIGCVVFILHQYLPGVDLVGGGGHGVDDLVALQADQDGAPQARAEGLGGVAVALLPGGELILAADIGDERVDAVLQFGILQHLAVLHGGLRHQHLGDEVFDARGLSVPAAW